VYSRKEKEEKKKEHWLRFPYKKAVCLYSSIQTMIFQVIIIYDQWRQIFLVKNLPPSTFTSKSNEEVYSSVTKHKILNYTIIRSIFDNNKNFITKNKTEFNRFS
jgi:hypothetical protein